MANGERNLYRALRVLVTLVLFLIIFLPTTAVGEVFPSGDRRVVIVIMDRITLQDLEDTPAPNIHRLINGGAVGLMNTRCAGPRNSPNAYAVIGAGKHVLSSSRLGEAFNTGSTVNDVPADAAYFGRTGMQPPANGVVSLGVPYVRQLNEKEGIRGAPGILGDALHKAGLETAVLGNADVPGEFIRDAAAVAMDGWGRVDYGNVSRTLLARVPDAPTGYRTDYDLLMEEFGKAYSLADLIVVETGDTRRVHEVAGTVFPEVLAEERRAAVRRADDFIGRVVDSVDPERTLIVLAAPLPPESALIKNNYMAPLVVRGPGIKQGTLTSATTRREGIVSNTDIAPTVLAFLGVPPAPPMTGRAVEVIPAENTVGQLLELNQDLVFIYNARPVLVKGYVFMQIAVMVMVIVMMIFWPRLLRFLRPLLLWLMAVPLSLLVVSAVEFVSLPFYAGVAVILAVLFVLGAYVLWRRRDVDLFIVLGLATSLAVLADIAAGAPLMKNSTLGYDAMSGARYYGIGNEYMGVLIGSSIIGVAAFWERFGRRFPAAVPAAAALFFLTCVVLMGAPQLGTNVGGTIAACAAFAFTFLRLQEFKIGFKEMAAIGAGVAAVIAAFAFYDMGRSVEVQSHLGRTANYLRAAGWTGLWEIILRKVNMNLKLIRYTIWSRVFLVMLGALGVAFYRPVGLMHRVRRMYPAVFRGLLGILIGSAVALAVNDSGIVAAATMMIFGTAPLIYLISRERENSYNSNH